MRSPDEIVEILNREVNLASERLSAARNEFEEILKGPAGELPQPDGAFRALRLASEQILARNQLQVALERSAEFTIHGIIPDDLQD